MSFNFEIFSWAYFPQYEVNIEYLANKLAAREVWSFAGGPTNDYNILKSYLEYTYRRLKQEGKIKFTSNNEYASFNTGLVTENLEDIYTFFVKNRIKSETASPYVFKVFVKERDNEFLQYFSDDFPEPANYFDDSSLLLYNPKLKLVINIDHIIEDNIGRFPTHLRSADPAELRRQIHGATEEIKKKVRNNYKLAVPQFHFGRFQLLLPLCLTSGSPNPDLALVVQKLNKTTYTARTCLTLRMAYNNARLIVQPQSDWLKP